MRDRQETEKACEDCQGSAVSERKGFANPHGLLLSTTDRLDLTRREIVQHEHHTPDTQQQAFGVCISSAHVFVGG